MGSDGHDTVQAKLVGLGLLQPGVGGVGWELTQQGRELLSATLTQAWQIHTRRGSPRARHDRTGTGRYRHLVGIHAVGAQACQVPAH